MSGIEAVFGAVASGAGLASLSIQLAESAMKLKRIYGAAKDAPRDISNMINDLDTMAMALRQLEQHRQQGYSAEALLTRCIAGCERSAAEIQLLVDKVEDSIKRHAKTGRLYYAFKQRDVKELLGSLERAKSSLVLAYMMYRAEDERRRDQEHADMIALHCATMNSLQAQILGDNAGSSQQIAFLPQHSSLSQRSGYGVIAASQNSPATDVTCVLFDEENPPKGAQIDIATRYGPAVTARRRRAIAKTYFRTNIRLPTWFSQRIVGFALTQAQWGWNLQLHTYNLVPYNSPIFHCCRRGNLAGVQKLLDSGMASPLDMWPSGWTLLDDAATSGQTEICRYLLGKTNWPDRTALMSRAISRFAMVQSASLRDKTATQMYRLFLAEPDFDPSPEDSWQSEGWGAFCANAESLEVILQSQSLDFNDQPLALRFEIACSLVRIDTSGFLKCIGLHASDRRLASIKTVTGVTVLHYVAKRIQNLLFSRPPSNEWQKWVALGATVLRNGANPSGISNTHHTQGPQLIVWRSTPLMNCLSISEGWRLEPWPPLRAPDVVYILHVWAKMLQQAGLDLFACGAVESDLWKTLHTQESLKSDEETGIEVVQLLYGPTPEDWSLKTSHCWRLDLYTLKPPPGAFIDNLRVPAELLWMPTNQERDEGPWNIVARKFHSTEPQDLRDLASYTNEPFTVLVDGTQDDAGVVALMQNRASRAPRVSSRSYSQPPCLRRREVAYYMRHETSNRPWLPEYHLCPFDSSWRVGCVEGNSWLGPRETFQEYQTFADNIEGVVFHVRSCVKGIVSSSVSLQESYPWLRQSFLSEIADCQDSFESTEGMRSMRHTGAPDCPQGCRKVLLNKIQVPEALREFHPLPRYGGPQNDWNNDDNSSHH